MVAKKSAAGRAASDRPTRARPDGEGAATPTGEEPVAETTGADAATGGAGHPAARKTPARKATAEKTPAKKATAKKTATKKTATKKTGARKTAAKRTATGVGSGNGKADAPPPAEQTGVTRVVAKKSAGTATATERAVEPGDLAVRPGEDPWTSEEVEAARAELRSEESRLRTEIDFSERSLAGLMRDSGEGAGHDEADTGSKNITREHELALAANAREMLSQTERALERLETGTYGRCENCGNPIGKARMRAFPRATLCVECKQKQERRY
ncbi:MULTISPECIES: TraR/DksA family transcriptional regulator [unclassified Streptomyces]|uniref:TraR/DksA family transcriptional regulator n=1 Tax=unclassified Streptomyces TaxID=2593676 RepID=UPI0019051F2D|nr:TraR/DksA family transcriptional regulator [Streptomyces sp. HSG2]